MTLLEALPRDEEGQIILPAGGVVAGVEVPGKTTEAFVEAAFADYCHLEVPLDEAQYQALLEASTPLWRRNWEQWRAEGRI